MWGITWCHKMLLECPPTKVVLEDLKLYLSRSQKPVLQHKCMYKAIQFYQHKELTRRWRERESWDDVFLPLLPLISHIPGLLHIHRKNQTLKGSLNFDITLVQLKCVNQTIIIMLEALTCLCGSSLCGNEMTKFEMSKLTSAVPFPYGCTS